MTINHTELLKQLQNNLKDIPEPSEAISKNSNLLHEYYLNVLRDALNEKIMNTTTGYRLLTKLHEDLQDFEYVIDGSYTDKVTEHLEQMKWLRVVKVSDSVCVYVDDIHKPKNAFVLETLSDGRLKIVRFQEYEEYAVHSLAEILEEIDYELIPEGVPVYSDESMTIKAYDSYADMWIANPRMKLHDKPIAILSGRIFTIHQPSLHHYSMIISEEILRTILK